MKIAVYHNLPPGGAKRTLYEELKFLSKNNKIFLFELSSSDESFLDLKGFAKKTYRYNFDLGSNLPGYLARLVIDWKKFIALQQVHKKIARKINSSKFDVVLVHPDRFTQAPYLLKFLKVPSTYYCHELLRIAYEPELEFKKNVVFYKNWYELLTRKLRKIVDLKNARYAEKILVNSRFTGKKVERFYKTGFKVCYPGVDATIFQPDAKKAKDTILFIGEKKKIDGWELIKASINLISKNYKVKFKVISFLSAKPRLSDVELARQYSKATVTLCAGYNEPFGLIPLESMSSGTPVIAVDEGGLQRNSG